MKISFPEQNEKLQIEREANENLQYICIDIRFLFYIMLY